MATARPGIACTLVVPTAISDGKPLPVLFVVAQDGKPDAKRWQDWGERRNCVVVDIQGYGYVTSGVDKQRIALKDLQAVIAQYPKTQAAIAAIKLVSRLQQSLR